ncbi:hypothetical protein ACEU6E_01685 [Halorutilales archaeon Cl-col2-1]
MVVLQITPGQIEQVLSFGILLLSLTLGVLSFLTWRRERDKSMLIVTGAYLAFGLRGLIVFVETTLRTTFALETVEHLSSFFIVLGLVLFFIAIIQE